jgi:hypothetical protein
MLHISEQTFYILMNLVNQDVMDSSRYAIAYQDERYVPVRQSDSEWALYQSVVELVQLEVKDVSDSLETLLEGIIQQQLPADTESDLWTGSASSVTYRYVSNVVPAGEIWLVQSIEAAVTTGPCSAIRFQAFVGGNYVTLEEIDSPLIVDRYNCDTAVYMVEGDRVRVEFRGCTVGVTDLRVGWAAAVYEIA